MLIYENGCLHIEKEQGIIYKKIESVNEKI